MDHTLPLQEKSLGPLLFIFYINDITIVPLSDGTMSLYADDLVFYCPITQQLTTI